MKSMKSRLVTLAFATTLPLTMAYAENSQRVIVDGKQNEVRLSGKSPCAAINWNVGADRTSSDLDVRGCISVDGYVFSDDSNTGLWLRGSGKAMVFPGACDNPREVRRVIDGRTVIIPSCN